MNSNDVLKFLPTLTQWTAEYFENIKQYQVFPAIQPGDIKKNIPQQAPEVGKDFELIFDEFKNSIMPGITHWQHPDFFAYFPAGRSRVSFLAEILESALGQQCMSWFSSPASSELEERTCDWIIEAIKLNSNFKGVLQDSGSTSNLVSILVAREWKTNFETNRYGCNYSKRLRYYASDQIHSSIDKGIRIAGIGIDNLIKIPCKGDFSIDTDHLEQIIIKDIEQGYLPCAIIAAYGTTSSTAIDDIDHLVEIKNKYQCWLHVDGSFAGCALILLSIVQGSLG
jgi:aromatic-L-amino-acid decarboxylase